MRLSTRLALTVGIPAGIMAATLIAVALQGQASATGAVDDALATAGTNLAEAQRRSLEGVAVREVAAVRGALEAKGRSLALVAAGLAGESLLLEDDAGLERITKRLLADEDCVGLWITAVDGTLRGGGIDTELKDLVQPLVTGKATSANALPLLSKLPDLPVARAPITVEGKALGTVILALSAAHLHEREKVSRGELAQVQSSSQDLLDQTQAGLRQTLAGTANRTAFFLLGAGGVGVLLLIPAGLVLGRRIARPMVSAGAALGAVAEGRYDVRLVEAGDAELIALARALNTTVATLAENQQRLAAQQADAESARQRLEVLVDQVRGSASTTADRAGQVRDGAQAVSARVEEVSQAMTQMAAASGEISTSSTEAGRLATDTLEDARRIDGRVRQLGAASDAIGGIIVVINGIANRTKLLALNASIEATKAGEAGRGFSVVAAEVRHLSQQTVEATGDIHRRIDAIQAEVATIMADIAHIAGAIERLEHLQGSVSAAVEEQSASTQQVTQNLADAAQASTGIAVAVAEVASAARATAQATDAT